MAKNFATFEEAYRTFFPHNDHDPNDPNQKKAVYGVLEFIIKDRHGRVVERRFEPNLIKIFAKEMLAHRLPSSQIWDITANGGAGGWVDSGIDPTEEFSARYILFGASFDSHGVPLDTNDPRYYVVDTVTGQSVPIRLCPGADYEGGLINAIPLTEPTRPLKRVEAIGFEATFQPAGTPLLQADVRGMNNILTLETTLRLDEYNGFGITDSDFFTICEVALVGGRKLDSIAACECDPKTLFKEGRIGSTGLMPFHATAAGSSVITMDPTDVNGVKEGDQIKIVALSDTGGAESIPQVSPFYLIISKTVGGRDCTLDRVPVTTTNTPITGPIGVYRETLRIFSHRILSAPLKKSADFEITTIWRIIMS
jgi:hypothetical protein